MNKGQLSIEFFLVLSIILVLAGTMLTVAEGHVSGIKNLNNAAIAKSIVDNGIYSIDFVYLSGNGSVLRREYFVPQGVLCFITSECEEGRICCISPGFEEKKVYSKKAISPNFVVNESCIREGWIELKARNLNNVVFLNCTPRS